MDTTSATPVVIVGGGQSGQTAARILLENGIVPVVLEAGAEPVGSWPRYYDSLSLFSPARFSGMPGHPFSGDPDDYPTRDEVVAFLRAHAAGLDLDIRTGTRVTAVTEDGAGLLVHTDSGEPIRAAGVVAASGAFGNPYRPPLPGQEAFTGRLLHAADYHNPAPYAGQRVVIVGGGNSAMQIGYDLAAVATVTLATRQPVRFLPQRLAGHDVHHWITSGGFDRLPPAWLARIVPGTLVLDTGPYERALEAGLLDRRPMFTALDGDKVRWADGPPETVDAVILATGYRPHLDYLAGLGALDQAGAPLHDGGLSLTHPGLVYLGLEFQRSFASNTLRGVHHDAAYVLPALTAHVNGAASLVGL